MKKKILSGIFALALLVATGYGVNQSVKSNANLSDMALNNVEALAQSESGDGKGTLYGNEAGDKFCCCPGSNSCGSASCSSCG
ncbi:NVEALA domain-containing protein [Proteiniphilum saccharofermentans]|uniref:NVEALA domain-containing protein n=1 Tax=Proteiniphilum saccharofermentans TaxID=1642647 RepID=UPI0028A58643|nr:NVEALA domain-containing protein [Proteiniphilum saccharofermentans]